MLARWGNIELKDAPKWEKRDVYPLLCQKINVTLSMIGLL